MNLLNIKTRNSFYLYDLMNRVVYGSNEDVYLVYQYLEMNKLDTAKCQEIELEHISNTLHIEKEKIRKAIEKIHWLEKIKNAHKDENKIQITEKMLVESIANVKQVIIEITENCNFDCFYCCYGTLYQNEGRANRNANIENIRSFLNQILQLKNSELNHSINDEIIISFYGGEPLLNFVGISQIVDFIKEKNIPVTFSMTTNGYLLDKHISYLVENKFKLWISLDGDENANVYRKSKTGEVTFSKVWANILQIKKEYPDYWNKNISFLTVLTNKTNTIELIDFFKKIDKTTSISTLTKDSLIQSKMNIFDQIYNPGLLEENKINTLKKKYPESYNEFKRANNEVIYDHICSMEQYWEIFSDNISEKRRKTSTCFPFENKIFISVDSKLYPCEKSNRKFIFGEYKNKFIFFIDNINTYYDEIFNGYTYSCSKCILRNNCPACYFCTPNIFKESCSMSKRKSDFQREMEILIENNEKEY